MMRGGRLTMVGAPLALVLAAATALSVSTTAPGARAQEERVPHPAHIHSGTCDELGDIVVPLADVEEDTAGEVFGATTSAPVEQSDTDVEMSLSDILAAPHAVNIHKSADEIQTYISCGDIGGRVVDGELLVGLMEIGDSRHNGIARFETEGDGTSVTVYLTERAGGDAEAAQPADTAAPAADTPAPAAETPAPAETEEAAAPADEATDETDDVAAQAAEEVPVDIRDFAFGPNPVEVAVGGTVSWTNQDAVPHTATADQRDVLQSGAIAPGTTFSQVFETPGEFNYFCEFHPNMTGTIVVK